MGGQTIIAELEERIKLALGQDVRELKHAIDNRLRTRKGLADDYDISLLYERYKTHQHVLSTVLDTLSRYRAEQQPLRYIA